MRVKYSHEIQPILDYVREHRMYRQAAGAAPFFYALPFAGAVHTLDPGITGGLTREGFTEFLLDLDHMVKQAERVVVEITDERTGLDGVYASWRREVDRHDQFVATVKAGGKWSDRVTLLDELDKFNDVMLELWKEPFIIDCFDPTGEQIMEREVFSHCEDISDEDKKVLLMPTELSTHDLMELDILRGLERDQDTLDGLIQERFHWIENDYAGARVLSVEYFRAEIDKVRHSYPNQAKRNERIQELVGQTERVVKEKVELMKKYGLSAPQRGVVNLFAFLTDWREERKRVNQLSFWVYQRFVDQLAEIMGIDADLVKMADPRERTILESNNAREVLLQRKVTGVVYAEDTRDGTTIISDDPEHVELYKETMDELMMDVGGETLTGNVANGGVVQGIVKVVNSQSEFDKFERGNILVSAMTRPELMPVIRQAGGIITDEGGVTCHAAVVSRELDIPCVIGTMNATLVLQDGDRVELNAESGEIRKLE